MIPTPTVAPLWGSLTHTHTYKHTQHTHDTHTHTHTLTHSLTHTHTLHHFPNAAYDMNVRVGWALGATFQPSQPAHYIVGVTPGSIFPVRFLEVAIPYPE